MPPANYFANTSPQCRPVTGRSYHNVLPCQDNTAVHHAYTDNLGIVCCNPVGVEDVVMRAKSQFGSGGLQLHELDERIGVPTTFVE